MGVCSHLSGADAACTHLPRGLLLPSPDTPWCVVAAAVMLRLGTSIVPAYLLVSRCRLYNAGQVCCGHFRFPHSLRLNSWSCSFFFPVFPHSKPPCPGQCHGGGRSRGGLTCVRPRILHRSGPALVQDPAKELEPRCERHHIWMQRRRLLRAYRYAVRQVPQGAVPLPPTPPYSLVLQWVPTTTSLRTLCRVCVCVWQVPTAQASPRPCPC